MARPGADVREAELLERAPQAHLRQIDTEALSENTLQVDAPPALVAGHVEPPIPGSPAGFPESNQSRGGDIRRGSGPRPFAGPAAKIKPDR